MQCLIATDFKIVKSNNSYYTSGKFYNILERYFNSFGRINLICRFVESPKTESKDLLIDDFINNILILRDYRQLKVKKSDILNLISVSELIVGRLPAIVGGYVLDLAQKKNKLTYAEIMGDAWDAYWNHSFAGKLIAPYEYLKTKKLVSKSNYALYVTDYYLQKRYPCYGEFINASNVNISMDNGDIIEKRKQKIEKMDLKSFSMMTSAAVDVQAKGHRFVFKAIKRLKNEGYNIKYYLAGGGDKSVLTYLAKKYRIEDNIVFLGELDYISLLNRLDSIDIYIQPSLQEGLPRAVIEAMSRGCPCLGSNTAGTPELLSKEAVFKRASCRAIIRIIKERVTYEWLDRQRLINYNKAMDFLDERLSSRRKAFFERIIEMNES